MAPAPENENAKEQIPSEGTRPLDLSLLPSDGTSDEKQKLWDAYREQQRRRSCPGCGDDGLAF